LIASALGIALLSWWWPTGRPPLVGSSAPAVERRQAAIATRGKPVPERRAPSLPMAAEQPVATPEAEIPEALPREAVVHVRLLHADGSPETNARVRPSCRGARLISRSEAEVVFAMPPGSCLVEGVRSDGLLAARADAVEVRAEAGDEIDVELVFPSERTGGIGIGIEEVDGGVLVTYVHPGSPADEAGLQEGDVIVEVDGLATTALDLPDFVSVMTGPEDTPISFVLAGESDTGTFEEELELTRAFLPERDS